ncbi:STAS domain-containing protein [Streptomyces niveiscabiei]|uniref:STAS domain-containing protein n=1 Tax=Streptomyces niveiscabiei TaxID=164115 RepID=UPI0029BADA48|nr:STAS domain-containing protein [Streptomyces niveiscabiei]MDX3380642.1 STAS domain-containing protein [Streptomyces niveiscabiei]
MSLPQLAVYRHDRRKRALITLAGEIDLESAPLVRAALELCLRDGIRAIDVDLTPVEFCDCSGLNVFLHAAERITAAGGTLQLHHPPPMFALVADIAGCGFLFLGLPPGPLPPPPGGAAGIPTQATTRRSAPLARLLSDDAR